MVADPRAPLRAHRLRPLAEPRRARVEPDEHGSPTALEHEGERQRVAAVQDCWRIDDEWWRESAVSRMYYEVRLESGRVITVYRDLIGGTWWLQRY